MTKKLNPTITQYSNIIRKLNMISEYSNPVLKQIPFPALVSVAYRPRIPDSELIAFPHHSMSELYVRLATTGILLLSIVNCWPVDRSYLMN